MAGKKNDVIRCSFCGKTQDQVGGKLISGPNGAFICYSCVDICAEIVDEDEFDRSVMDDFMLMNTDGGTAAWKE